MKFYNPLKLNNKIKYNKIMVSYLILDFLLKGYDILVSDETFFSSGTFKKKSWGIKGKGNLAIPS